MSVLLYLIPLALVLGLAGLAGFIWSLNSGQYDDLDGAAQRILLDEDGLTSHQRKSGTPGSSVSTDKEIHSQAEQENIN